MRIYEGSPRQDWEEVLRSIGAWVDRERLKEILLVELEGGFLVQALAVPGEGAWSEAAQLAKRTFELTDDRVAELIDEAAANRREGRAPSRADEMPHLGIVNYYELALRVIGAYVDAQHPRDLFFFEQEGSFVLRLLGGEGSAPSSHRLAEFTRDEIGAMIEAAPEQRR